MSRSSKLLAVAIAALTLPLAANAASYTVIARVLMPSGTVKGGAINCYNGNGACSATFTSPMTFQAVPDSGFAVDKWSGCTPSVDNSTCSVPGTGTAVVSVYFKQATVPPPPTYYNLTSRIMSNAGAVTATGINGTSLNCVMNSGACLAQEAISSVVTLSARPFSGFAVQSWSGCTPSADGSSCTVTMSSDKVVYTSFVAVQACIAQNGTGTQTWDANVQDWTACVATACDQGYQLQNGACVPVPGLAYVGSFNVNDGPAWGPVNLPTYTCQEACALLFGGAASTYACSTTTSRIDHLAWASGWGDGSHCATNLSTNGPGTPVSENYKLNTVYQAPTTSAYVRDWCLQGNSINYCYR